MKLDPQMLKAATRAWLRLVVEDIAPGEATVRVGRKEIVLPKAVTSENINRTLMLPIAPAELSADTPFAFRVNQGNHAGYRVDMTSIVLESHHADDKGAFAGAPKGMVLGSLGREGPSRPFATLRVGSRPGVCCAPGRFFADRGAQVT